VGAGISGWESTSSAESDVTVYMQPFAPFATTLEGTLLGALEIPHVAGRTILSAVIACGFLYWSKLNGLGLIGVWLGMTLVVVCNMFADLYKITSSSSPVRQTSTQVYNVDDR
jgi:hypothetical protein